MLGEDLGSDSPSALAPTATPAASPFPPISDYAFLSDCETCALVAGGGQVEWLCLPRPDSPSVFGSMLDRSAGIFGLLPENVSVPSHRRYLPGSLVLETTWQTDTGWMIVRDALVMAPWYDVEERSTTHRRTPSDSNFPRLILALHLAHPPGFVTAFALEFRVKRF